MQGKPKAGIILMRADWFEREIAAPVLDAMQQDADRILERINAFFDVSGSWIVSTQESAVVCQRQLHDADLDLVLFTYQGWGDDVRLLPLLQAVGDRPVVIWCYLPWQRAPYPMSFNELKRSSGPVGTLGALGTLRNLGLPFLFVYGGIDDPTLARDLQVAGRAALVRRALHAARIGLLPSRSEQVQSTFVDEFRLLADLGPSVQYFSVNQLTAAVNALDPNEIEQRLVDLKQRVRVEDVTDDTLRLALRAAYGLAGLCKENRLDVLSMNDNSPELMRSLGLRPCLFPEGEDIGDTLLEPSADLGAATANFILDRFSKKPTMLLEFWFWDIPRNYMIGGHSGVHNPNLAAQGTLFLSRDYENYSSASPAGAHYQFIAAPGRVTLFQLRSTPQGWQAIATSGVCIDIDPRVEGLPHAVVRLDEPIEYVLHRAAAVGSTQHWVMGYGDLLPELEALCELVRIPLEVISLR